MIKEATYLEFYECMEELIAANDYIRIVDGKL